MLVKELIEYLKEMPQDALVVMSKDAEGNCYSPFSDMANAVYVPTTTWYGDVYSLDWTAKDVGMEDDEWEKFKKEHQACIVLWPTN